MLAQELNYINPHKAIKANKHYVGKLPFSYFQNVIVYVNKRKYLISVDCSFKVFEKPSKFAVRVVVFIVMSAQSVSTTSPTLSQRSQQQRGNLTAKPMTTQTYFSRKSTRKLKINYYFEIKYFSNILCYRRKIAKASKTGGLQYRAEELNKSKGWTKSVQISEQCVALTHNHYLHLHNVQFVPSRMSGPIHFRVLYSVQCV